MENFTAARNAGTAFLKNLRKRQSEKTRKKRKKATSAHKPKTSFEDSGKWV